MNIALSFPLRLVSVANLREHWAVRAKRVDAHRGLARMLTLAAFGRARVGPKALLPCVVTLTRIAPRPLDGDNAQAAAKACRDGVADAFGLPDNDPRITWAYAQRKGAPREYAVEIEIAQTRGKVA